MKLIHLTKQPNFTMYEGDNHFDGRTFEWPLIQGECSEIDNVHMLVSWPTPLTQYLLFLVSQIDNFFTSGDHSDHWWKGTLQPPQQHTYNVYYLLGLLHDTLSCLLRTCCFLKASFPATMVQNNPYCSTIMPTN